MICREFNLEQTVKFFYCDITSTLFSLCDISLTSFLSYLINNTFLTVNKFFMPSMSTVAGDVLLRSVNA